MMNELYIIICICVTFFQVLKVLPMTVHQRVRLSTSLDQFNRTCMVGFVSL